MAGERSFSVDIRALLEALTEQFPEPLLCVRELVQNAADAGARHIAIEVAYDRERRSFRLSVTDDGRGMQASEVEGYLTIGYSDKDPARHRGRFGVGKLSPYALGISHMVVLTCDGEVRHRIEFDARGHGTMSKEPGRTAGTSVRVYKTCDRPEAEQLARKTYEVTRDTCAGLPLRIDVNGVGISSDAAALAGAYVYSFETKEAEAELRGQLGISAEPAQRLSSGHILLETGAPVLGEAVSYSLDSQLLSPTLSRNAARRDAAYDRVVRAARARIPELERHVIAVLDRRVTSLRRRGPVERHLEPDDRAAVEWLRARLLGGDPARTSAISRAPVLETAEGDLVSLDDLRAVARREGAVPTSRTPRSADEVSGYAGRGVPVLLLYRDVEDFLDRESIRGVEVESRELGPEVEVRQYTPGERALLLAERLDPPRFRRVLGLAVALGVAGLAGGGFGLYASRAVGPLEIGAPARPPAPTSATPRPELPTGTSRPIDVTWPLAGAGAVALGAAAASAWWTRRKLTFELPVRQARPRRVRLLWRALRHPRDYIVARAWIRRSRQASEGDPAGPGNLEGYRELVPEPEIPVGVRLDLDQLKRGLVDLRGPEGGRSDARVLVVREGRALLNRNHPTVRRLVDLAGHDVVRARILLDALLATDPELAGHADPRQAEWDLVARARVRLKRARARTPTAPRRTAA